MTMTKEKLKSIIEKYPICGMDEAEIMLEFASDILDGEAEATEQTEPYATSTIERYRATAYNLFEISQEVGRMEM